MIWTIGMYFVIGAIAMVLYVAGVVMWLGSISKWNVQKANDIVDWFKSNPATLAFDSLNPEMKLRGYAIAWVTWPWSIPQAIAKIDQEYKNYKENHL